MTANDLGGMVGFYRHIGAGVPDCANIAATERANAE
jgi:hypothetical protein